MADGSTNPDERADDDMYFRDPDGSQLRAMSALGPDSEARDP